MLRPDFKKFFFDSPAVQNSIDRAAARSLSRFGAAVRGRDQKSMKYGKKPSAPGTPPTAHRSPGFTRTRKFKTGHVAKRPASPLRELTFFAYEPSRRSVVIGPAIFRNSKIGGGKAPRTIELGGTGPFISDGRVRIGRFAARPHTGPAFRAELPNAASLFRGTVSR